MTAAAVALAAALGAYPALDGASDLVAVLGVAGTAAAVLALRLGSLLLPLPLLILGAELELHDAPRTALPAYAAGLLLLGELISWSRSMRTIGAVDPKLVTDRIAFLSVAAIGAAALAGVVDAAAGVPLTGGLGDAVLGTCAAVLLVAAILAGVRRWRARPLPG